MIIFSFSTSSFSFSWYYITAGLALWAIDHALRLSNCLGTNTHLQSILIKGNGDVVSLAYTVSRQQSLLFGGNPLLKQQYSTLPHYMGQYVFINVPLVSQLAWHPFTISSAPNDPQTTHHIKVGRFREGV